MAGPHGLHGGPFSAPVSGSEANSVFSPMGKALIWCGGKRTALSSRFTGNPQLHTIAPGVAER